MSELIEKVARLEDWGQCETCGVVCEGCTECNCARPTWMPISTDNKARAAIAAVFDWMAEPSEAATLVWLRDGWRPGVEAMRKEALDV